MQRVRAGLMALKGHLDYITALAESRKWLAGDELSAADLAAAAHLSCLDYIGEVPWDQAPEVKHWYQRVKSRPSFRTLLGDHVRGLTPPASYADLDF
jgi:glutathione S-transferase